MFAHTAVTGTILVVDDDPDALLLLSETLQTKGHVVTLAPTANQALSSFQSMIPDLVLLDVLLPDMDGFKVCSYMKAMGAETHVPVIFISGLTDTVDKVKGFEVGGADFITKPFAGEEVLARVAMHLELKRILKEKDEHNTRLEQQIERYKAGTGSQQRETALRFGESELLATRGVEAYHLEQMAWLREQFAGGGGEK
ncbi:MAG: response regulator [Magnetococcales bacterium]|nr:response regulator [Magnetococcales bacterium]